MDINLNNALINTFVGGMNSDTSLDLIQDNQYLFGFNIRISNNTVIFEESTSNNKEGILCPVRKGTIMQLDIDKSDDDKSKYSRILAVDSIKDYGVIILEDDAHHWNVFRILYKDEECLEVKKLFTSSKTVGDIKRFSVVLNEEIKNIIKLYIANGKDEIMLMFVKYDGDDTLNYMSLINGDLRENFKIKISDKDEKILYNKEDLLKSNYIFPVNKPIIADKVSGHLKTSLILYTYRFYKKHGITSKLSPLTNKIQVINDSKQSETGCAEDTITNIGFLLNIPCNEGFATLFDRLLIYRLDYIKPLQNAEVNLIYDGELIYDTGDKISITDVGNNSLQSLTIEEFSQLNGQDIIPKTIESTLGYMFASNIKDLSSIHLTLDLYNPRAYQFDKEGNCILYEDSDVTYTGKAYKKESYPENIDDIKRYTHNNLSDVNYTGKLLDGCFLRKSDNLLGGEGPNISWKFIVMLIGTHQDVDNIKKPDLSYDLEGLLCSYISSCVYKEETIEMSSPKKDTTYFEEKGVYNKNSYDYNNIMGSSLCRSLQRNEVYRYGIVFYDERGIRTDVLWIADIRTPSIKEISNVSYIKEVQTNPGYLYALSLGIEFEVKMPTHPDEGHTFVGYEIVRCEKNYLTSHNVLQVALSNPVHQLLPELENKTAYSPYYPTGLISTNPIEIKSSGIFGAVNNDIHQAHSSKTPSLYLIFNPQILYQRQDILQQLQNTQLDITCIKHIYKNIPGTDSNDLVWGNFINTGRTESEGDPDKDRFLSFNESKNGIDINRAILNLFNGYQMSYKLNKTTVFNLYKSEANEKYDTISIIDVLDVKNPTWEEGFSNIKFDDKARVATAVSAYKSFITSVLNDTYINWACCGMYDITTGVEDTHGTYNDIEQWLMFTDVRASGNGYIAHARKQHSNGYIGPGPVCFLIKTDHDFKPYNPDLGYLHTAICQLTHKAVLFSGLTEQEKQYDLYYGFGNFVKFDEGTVAKNKVFDGDIYNIPCEFISLFKTYDFNCLTDALPSTLIVYYIPMESRINTFFDYGMNFKNTTNPNLQLEPGRIDGVSNQTRPLHQINLIYSDNTNSNNMFNPQTLQKPVNLFLQRILYSLLKTNGENIDNWLIFKAIDFIDTDSKYGLITNLLAVNDILYFWQEQSFGKLSVNERSLVTDNNNNTVQLGQGGVLQRSDYLDTKHGMREYDYSAINTGYGLFWIDVLNKCIAVFAEGRVINYSEYKNILSIMNTYCIDNDMLNNTVDKSELVTHLPTIHHDLQNDELLCDYMFGSVSPKKEKYRMLLVINTKTNIATSMYNRKYENILSLNGRLYGINLTDGISFTKYNHLHEDSASLLTPTIILFVVNKSASDTKVFDNQKIVTLKKTYTEEEQDEFFKNKILYFETDINASYKDNITEDLILHNNDYHQITNRESNILYAIPRETKDLTNDPIQGYGKRLRGKWMQVYIKDDNPKLDYSISHIITKFRQSFN